MLKLPLVLVVITAVLLAGCGVAQNARYNEAVEYYAQAAPMVELGMSESAFQALMAPALEVTRADKKPTRYSRGGSLFVVYYPRSAEYWDSAITDDEYTPYIFMDGRLVAVGWDAIGGMTYTSRDVREAEEALERARASATRVKVEQNNNNSNNGGFGEFCVPDLNGDGRCMGAKCC